MPCASIAARVLGDCRGRASRPPWTAGMQRLHAAIQHLGKAGEVGHIAHGEPRLAQRFRRAAGRDQLDALAGKAAGEVCDARLVGNGNQRAADRSCLVHDAGGKPRRSAAQAKRPRRMAANADKQHQCAEILPDLAESGLIGGLDVQLWGVDVQLSSLDVQLSGTGRPGIKVLPQAGACGSLEVGPSDAKTGTGARRDL